MAEGFEWILRTYGVKCHHYLDDTFGWVAPPINVMRLLEFVNNVAGRLGLATAPHKILLGRRLEILGITIDCDRGVAFIGEHKLEKISAALEDARRSVDLMQIQSLVGSLVFVTKVCGVGQSLSPALVRSGYHMHELSLWPPTAESGC